MESTIHQAGAVTEASMQPIRYFRGERGTVTIRRGTRQVQLEPEIMNTYYFQLDEVYSKCPIAQAINTCPSIEAANAYLLNHLHLISEFEREKRNLTD